MGCDIHLYIEHVPFADRDGGLYWVNFGGRFNPGRDYAMFGKLAGVRGEGRNAIVPPRGLPTGRLGFSTSDDWWLYISDTGGEGEGVVPRAKAEEYARYAPPGENPYRLGSAGEIRWVRHPDWHTASWLTRVEYDAALLSVGGHDVAYDAVSAVMSVFARAGQETRVVFWFDN